MKVKVKVKLEMRVKVKLGTQLPEQKEEEEDKEEDKLVIKRQIGRWSVRDYTIKRNPEIKKYLRKASNLFPHTETNSLLVDVESWYSITPSDTADEISCIIKKIYGDRVNVLDLFSGVGGNTISFAKHGFNVTSVEKDYQKIKYQRHNLNQCVGAHKVDLIHGDVYSPQTINRVRKKGKYSVILMAPPWGGIDYKQDSGIELIKKCRVFDLEEIYEEMSDLRIYLLPRSIPFNLFYRLFNCKVVKGISNTYHILNILIVGDNFSLYK